MSFLRRYGLGAFWLDTTPGIEGFDRAGGDHRMPLPFARTVVAGDSMLPALRPGDCLLVSRRAQIAEGDLIVVRRPHVEGLLLVKRAVRRADGGWWVLSDNAAVGLDDSRAFGVLPDACVVGKVLFRYYRPSRRS